MHTLQDEKSIQVYRGYHITLIIALTEEGMQTFFKEPIGN